MKSELHEAVDVEYIIRDMIANAKTKLISIPGKAAPMIIGYTDIPRIQSILQKAIEETLEDLANYVSEGVSNDVLLLSEGERNAELNS